MLVAHVHDRCRFRPVSFIAEEAVEVLLNQGGDAADGALLARPILAGDTLARLQRLKRRNRLLTCLRMHISFLLLTGRLQVLATTILLI